MSETEYGGPLLTTEQVDEAGALAGLGLTVEQMARFFKMSKAAFDRKLSATPGAREALEKGRAQAIAQVSQHAFEMAIAKDSKGRALYPVMTMFWLKCRGGWKERSDFDPPVGVEGQTWAEFILECQKRMNATTKPERTLSLPETE